MFIRLFAVVILGLTLGLSQANAQVEFPSTKSSEGEIKRSVESIDSFLYARSNIRLSETVKTRLIAACRKLRDTDDDMSNIAFSCGFGDQNILGRHFRRYFGMTPSAFRAWQWKTFPRAANDNRGR